MVKKNLLLLCVVLIAACFFNYNCNSCSKKKDVPNERINPVKAAHIEYQEDITQCEAMEAQIRKYHSIYRESQKKAGSVLDEDESKIVSKEILKHSRQLLSFSNECMNKKNVIRRVSGAAKRLEEYQAFATRMINKFENLP